MHSLIASAGLLAGALLLGAAGSASATDGKLLSPSGCHIKGLAITTTVGTLENVSKLVTTTVRCALDRDTPAQKPLKVEVAVTDNSSLLLGDATQGDFTCFLSVFDKFGRTGSSGAAVKTTGTNAGGTILNVPIPAATIDKGQYVLTCTMPRRGSFDPASSIGSIYVQEPDET